MLTKFCREFILERSRKVALWMSLSRMFLYVASKQALMAFSLAAWSSRNWSFQVRAEMIVLRSKTINLIKEVHFHQDCQLT